MEHGWLLPQVAPPITVTLGGSTVGATGGIVEPSYVADVLTAAISEGRFLVLPHPEVQTYAERKASDPDRWLRGMRKLRRRSLDVLAGE